MKRLAAIALIAVGAALPVCAQRAASHGGFSGRSGSASRGGFRASAPSRFTSPSRYTGSRYLSVPRNFQRGSANNLGAHPVYATARRGRKPERPHSRQWGPYAAAPWVGGIGPYVLGYPDDTGYGDASAAPSNVSGGDDTQAADQRQPESPDYDHYQPAPETSSQPAVGGNEEAVTIIFKDGRPAEQIHNYVLTRKTLYVLDQRHRVLPTSIIDLVATAKVNNDAGVYFQLPDASGN